MSRVVVGYHQYDLIDVGPGSVVEAITDFSAQPGFLVVETGLIVVRTGTDTGNVEVELSIYDSPPVSLRGWEEVYEAEMATRSGRVEVRDFDGPRVEGLPAFVTSPGGRLGVRVHVSGRETGEQEYIVSGEPVEHHHIQLWPIQ